MIATTEANAHPVYKQKNPRRAGTPNRPHDAGGDQRPDEPQIGETKIGGQTVPLPRLMGFPPSVDATRDLESMDFDVGLVADLHDVFVY